MKMSKKLAIINDLSGFGRCSLTAAISVTTTMGVQACPLPTAILSSQTGYPSYVHYDFTHEIGEITTEWEKINPMFSGIYIGFISSVEQIDEILNFVKKFHHAPTFLMVDPIMGDNGHIFSIFSDEIRSKIKQLTLLADIIIPNLTELCILTDTDYATLQNDKSVAEFLESIHEIARTYCLQGPAQIVITGIRYTNDSGQELIGNSYVTSHTTYHYATPNLGGSYSGTGDLFAACLAAGIAQNIPVSQIIPQASSFIQAAIADSIAHQVPSIEGINYEKFLHLLYEL